MNDWQFGHLEPGKARDLSMDPPWLYKMGTKGRPQHYPRMSDSEIAALRITELLDPRGAYVKIWLTAPMTARFWTKIYPAYHKMGLRYSSRFAIWIKTHKASARGQTPLFFHRNSFFKGQGLTTRKNAEECLLFKFKKPPPRLHKGLPELIVAPLREHSRKPDEYYEMCEAYSEGPHVELFSRCDRPGWQAWGNEAGKFNEAAA